MSIKEQIRAEIERLKKENDGIRCKANDAYCVGYNDAFYDLLAFLDSLPEQPVEGLEEEIDKWVISLQNEPGSKWKHSDILRTARHFAEWGAEHLKK